MSLPTPYPDVNAVLLDFTARLQTILGSQFLGLYLYGSLALGDFDPDMSDIDFIVVTQGELSQDLIAALQTLHITFDQSGSPWAGKIEVAYIPHAALNHSAPTSAAYPQVEKGTPVFCAPLEIGWAFQRCTLQAHGITVAGPDIRGLVGPVAPAALQRAAAVITVGWLEQSRQDSAWVAWARQLIGLSFIVLTLCRFLYTLETGVLASKPAAARWMQANAAGRWDTLIQHALAGQHSRQLASDEDMESLLALLSYTAARCQG
jgi:hypothetical protein